MYQCFKAKRLFDGTHIYDEHFFCVENGVITQVAECPLTSEFTYLEGLVAAGFIDVQVNGGGGVLFNAEPNLTGLRQILASHMHYGTTSMLPTLITDDIKVMRQAAAALSHALQERDTGVLGIHFEGPHLCLQKRGIHQAQFIRPPTDQELALYTRKDLGKVVVTLAPEIVPLDLISELTQTGVVVCLGHSNASAEQVFAALEAGAKGFTHLFNAMSALNSRAPGMVGAALLHQQSYAGLIADLEHVHGQSCELAIRCKGPEKIMLVTDAMHLVGQKEDTANYFDQQITRHGNKLTLADGTLAGSALDMAKAIRNVHMQLGLPLTSALSMASASPADFLGLNDKGRLVAGQRADFVLLNDNLKVQQVWRNGALVYSQ